MGLLIKQNYMRNNDCYRTGQRIAPKGVMVHSDGCRAGIKASGWFSRWNKPGIEVCVHAFLDDRECIEYLPTDKGNCIRAWHGGGSSNNTHIGFEMCEPTDYKDSAYFNKVYKNAVEYTAHLLKKHGITVVNDNTVLCHCEGYRKGIATNHGDVMHWFKYHNRTMDDFRNDVRKALNGSLINTTPPASSNNSNNTSTGYTVKITTDVLRVRTGAGENYPIATTVKKGEVYTIVAEQNGWGKLKSGAGWISLEYTSKNSNQTQGANQTPSSSEKRYAENGTYYFDTAVTVRTAPEENAKTNVVYYAGESVIYHHVILNKNGFNWIEYARNNGTTGYLKVKDLSTCESYGYAK